MQDSLIQALQQRTQSHVLLDQGIYIIGSLLSWICIVRFLPLQI